LGDGDGAQSVTAIVHFFSFFSRRCQRWLALCLQESQGGVKISSRCGESGDGDGYYHCFFSSVVVSEGGSKPMAPVVCRQSMRSLVNRTMALASKRHCHHHRFFFSLSLLNLCLFAKASRVGTWVFPHGFCFQFWGFLPGLRLTTVELFLFLLICILLLVSCFSSFLSSCLGNVC
jgi:hypothetical protein